MKTLVPNVCVMAEIITITEIMLMIFLWQSGKMHVLILVNVNAGHMY